MNLRVGAYIAIGLGLIITNIAFIIKGFAKIGNLKLGLCNSINMAKVIKNIEDHIEKNET